MCCHPSPTPEVSPLILEGLGVSEQPLRPVLGSSSHNIIPPQTTAPLLCLLMRPVTKTFKKPLHPSPAGKVNATPPCLSAFGFSLQSHFHFLLPWNSRLCHHGYSGGRGPDQDIWLISGGTEPAQCELSRAWGILHPPTM